MPYHVYMTGAMIPALASYIGREMTMHAETFLAREGDPHSSRATGSKWLTRAGLTYTSASLALCHQQSSLGMTLKVM